MRNLLIVAIKTYFVAPISPPSFSTVLDVFETGWGVGILTEQGTIKIEWTGLNKLELEKIICFLRKSIDSMSLVKAKTIDQYCGKPEGSFKEFIKFNEKNLI